MGTTRTIIFGLLAIAVGSFCYYQFSQRNNVPPINDEAKELYSLAQQLTGLHGPVGQSSWLRTHHEPGQTFGQYTRIPHIRLTEERNVLYVLPLGEFNEKQMQIVDLSAEFLSHYFMCEVKTLDTMGLDVVPQEARRVHPSWGMRQVHTRFILDKLLPPLLPDDAVAMIAFTSSDLYPEDSWNFVYGQASLRNRVGVWSLFRNGDPDVEFETVLRRTLKTASHETGHMFTIEHCIAYECNMCGCNNREESDRHPLYLCPECVPKIWWSTECDPVERYQRLLAFCEKNNLDEEASYYAKSIKLLQ